VWDRDEDDPNDTDDFLGEVSIPIANVVGKDKCVYFLIKWLFRGLFRALLSSFTTTMRLFYYHNNNKRNDIMLIDLLCLTNGARSRT
jgi:hypothetical protein